MRLAADVSPRHPSSWTSTSRAAPRRWQRGGGRPDLRRGGSADPRDMEHIERAGVHSGDSMAVCPPVSLSQSVQDRVVDYATRMARALNTRADERAVRAGQRRHALRAGGQPPRQPHRALPLQDHRHPMVNVATSACWAQAARTGLHPGPLPRALLRGEGPRLLFSKLTKVDTTGPEMKSNGEIMAWT